jgi:hypothetical protein
MASRKILEMLRQLPPEERRKEVQRLSELWERSFFKGTSYQIARRSERMRRAKDEGNRRIFEAMARVRDAKTKENVDDATA